MRLKRVFDVAVASISLVVLSPVMAVVAVVVRTTMGRPVLFTQQRPGLHGHLFTMYKFRTMRPGQGDDASRVTPVGEVLRATSLDELPELWNILRGDMSVVGPRPLLPEYLELYTPTQARRHEVRPGLTGLAQVSGRNATTWEHRLALDVRYVDTRSFGMDLRIIARTVGTVVRRTGVRNQAHATMPRFSGAYVSGQEVTDM